MHSLPLFHRIKGQGVVVLGEGAVAEARRRLVERAGGVVAEVDEDAALGFVAFGDDRDEETGARHKARGVLVNVADRPELCDFTLPSVLERGPLLVAVSSGGLSAGLTKALRLRLETLIPEATGRLDAAFGAARTRIKQRWPDVAERRLALDAAVAAGGPLDLLGDHDPGALDAWLARAAAGPPAVHDFTLTSDDPDDLTLRQARLLGSADVIRHDPRVAAAILSRARADARRKALDDPSPDQGLVVILRR
jgi:uroporphyrin-III C-methyltransferase/precorrin-2 dehydrogenase/sirohydrochlorin ferrochelatase